MKRLAFLGILIAFTVSCNQQKTEVVQKNENKQIPVKVAKAEIRHYIPYLDLSGTAYADREANLGAALPGRVEKIYYPAGSRVRKGDLLVSMSGELYTQALVEFNTIKKDYERVSRLNDKGSISSQDYDHVKAQYEASEAKVAMMKKNAEIIAPFSGTIVEYLVQEGENYFFNLNLDPGYSSTSGILRLMKLDPVQVEVEINEKDLGKIEKGQKANITFDAIQNTVFTGKISSVKEVLSTMTHSSTVRIEVSNASGHIKPGMFAHVNIELTPVDAVFVPLNSVNRLSGTAEDFVFVTENGRVIRKKIEKLWTDNTLIAVEGINADDQVVTSGKEKLHEGSLIEIK